MENLVYTGKIIRKSRRGGKVWGEVEIMRITRTFSPASLMNRFSEGNKHTKLQIMEDRKEHWDTVYEDKKVTEVSWYEPTPTTSLDYIEQCQLEKDAAIIDIGGGDSFLAEFLISQGFTDITVVDISENAVERAKQRLGEKAETIKWIVTDVADLVPQKKYDLWHDRAAFHFLTADRHIENYLEVMRNAVKPEGYVIMGTFSENGPSKCSGIQIRQYSISQMQDLFSEAFTTVRCKNIDHTTPSGGTQNFTFCSFRKNEFNEP